MSKKVVTSAKPTTQSPPAKNVTQSPPKNAPQSPRSKAPQVQPAKSQVKEQPKKEQPKVVPKGQFDPAPYTKSGVAEEVVLQIKNAFDLFDTDQGGSIDTKELKAAMVSLGFDSKNGSIFQMITELDSDGNGNLDFNEFFGLMTTKISDKNSRAQYSKVFAIYDDERKGYITADNLVRIAQTLGESITEAEVAELIKRADIDGDGVISEEEFYAIMTKKV